MITSADIAAFRNAINEFNADLDKTQVVLHKSAIRKDNFGEEVESSEQITLLCTLAYNHFRTWPINIPTPSGLVDKENLTVIFNFDYLDSLGLITSGAFDIDIGTDQFLVEGTMYGIYGHTNVSQDGSSPLLVYVILQKLPK